MFKNFIQVHYAKHDNIKKLFSFRVNLGTRLILGEFNQIHIALSYWCLYNLGSLLFFYLFKLWTTVRINHLPRKGE